MNRRIVGLLLALFALPVGSHAGELIHFKDTTTSWANVMSIASKEKKMIFVMLIPIGARGAKLWIKRLSPILPWQNL